MGDDAKKNWEERGKMLKSKPKVQEETNTFPPQDPISAEEKVSIILGNDVKSIATSKKMVDLYNENAEVGSENLLGGGKMPVLKVYGGKGNTFMDEGVKPTIGYFVHKTTKQQYQTINAHILTISDGFYAPKLGGAPGETSYQNIVGGLMIVENDYIPFITYINSSENRGKMWAFQNEAREYKRIKPMSIPMFSLTVKLFTSEYKYTYEDKNTGKDMSGESFAINYEVLKDEEKHPVLVGDEGKFIFLRDSVEQMKRMIENAISLATKKSESATPAEVVQ